MFGWRSGPDAFGSSTFNLTRPLFVPTSSPSSSLLSSHSIILLHAVLASVTWLVVAPLAVLLHRLGRSGFPPVLLAWHGWLQSYWTLPVTGGVFVLGVLGSPHGALHLSMHKAMGAMLVAMLVAQVVVARRAQARNRPGELPLSGGRQGAEGGLRGVGMHVVMGAMLLLMGYMQLASGWREITHHHRHPGEGPPDEDEASTTKVVLGGVSLALGALCPLLYFALPRILALLPGNAMPYRSQPIAGPDETTADESDGHRAIPLLEGRGRGLSEDGGEFDLGSDSEERDGDEEEKGRAWRRP